MLNFRPHGPVVYWHPFNGERHALWPVSPPEPDQERDTVCGLRTVIERATELEWLAPTCHECWAKARALRDARISQP